MPTSGNISQPWESIPEVKYINSMCEGERYYSAKYGDGYYFPEFTAGRGFVFVEGKLWYPSEQGCLEGVPVWRVLTGTCGKGPQPETICPIRIVPDWVENLLPNPPYSLAVEYEANTP